MTLHISIIKYPEGAAVAETSRAFEGGGLIGRGEDNDWVLDDPERYLSSRHSEITCEQGRYYLTDLSTNGTFVNGSAEPLGKGVRVALNDGDQFSFGDYEFQVSLGGDAAAGGDPAWAAADDPFGAPPASPFDAPPAGGPVAGDVPADPFGSGHVPESDPLFSVGEEQSDPLAALDNASRTAEPAPGFGEAGTSYSDGAGALNESVDWPEAKPDAGLIPEDWDADTVFNRQKPEPSKPLTDPPPPLEDPPPQAPATPQPARRAESPRRPEPPGAAEAPARPASAQPAAADDGETRARALERANKKIQAELDELKRRQRDPADTAGGVDRTLVKALGLSSYNLSDEEIAEINHTVGELMRETIFGLMQVLTSRSSIKNEFRMQVTTIQPVENNPLKFSANVDDALENMFVKKGDAYKAPVEAVREGFESIAEHQMAVLAGMRSAFKSVLDSFAPEQVEQRFEKRHKGSVVIGSRKAKLWDLFAEYYQDQTDDLDNSFQHLFGDEFVQAYEDQLQRLAIARKSKKQND